MQGEERIRRALLRSGVDSMRVSAARVWFGWSNQHPCRGWMLNFPGDWVTYNLGKNIDAALERVTALSQQWQLAGGPANSRREK